MSCGSAKSVAVMNGRRVMKVAAALYFAEASVFALAAVSWPFASNPPFVLHKAIFGGIVALASALVGIWALKIGRNQKDPTPAFLTCSGMVVVGLGSLAGYTLIGILLPPMTVAFFGVHKLRKVES